MGKFLAIMVVLASMALLACASGAEIKAGISEQASTDSTSNQWLSRDDSVTSGPPGAVGPQGPAGPAGAPSAEGFGFSGRDGADLAPAATPAPRPAQPPAVEEEGAGESTSTLQVAQRRVISTASISIEVEEVQATVNRVRTIAEGLGGFVEQLSSSGGSERQQASMTVRVPQDQFFTALERLEGLGEVQSRNVGSEDVSERFIDLEARLKSSQREETSLLNLLERATQVSEILTIERELNRVRSEIERLQGQLNFLERRVELATISISLFPPGQGFSEPPSASLVIEHQSDLASKVNEIKNLVSSMNGEVDRVFLTSRDGQERADISFRVFPKDFGQAVEFLEGSGKVRSKDLREATSPPAEDSEQPEEPNATIGVTLTETEPTNTGLIIGIAAPVGGVLLVIILAAAFYFTYRAGRNRRDRFVQAA